MGKKGSQLRAFKNSLAAITRPGSKRKGSKLRQVTRDSDTAERAEKLRSIEQQFNSFEAKFTRSKHDIAGRKVKGKVGKPSLAKQLDEQSVLLTIFHI